MSFLKFTNAGQSPSGKTEIVAVYSLDGMTLGKISWYAPWRRYVLQPISHTFFDSNCLQEIAGHIDLMMRVRRGNA